jgi:UDP-GlcNAc:undecaprenyl-phosphate GlcNAc-1-phosphate transferase
MGGVPIWVATAVSLGISIGLTDLGFSAGMFWSTAFAGGTVILLLGLYDDVRGARASAKLAVGALAALLVSLYGWRVPLTGLEILDILLGAAWLVFFMNAFNVFDGLDGLAAGCGSISLAFLGVWFMLSGEPALATVSWVLAAAALGFLCYNFPPARGIFLGDNGSLFLGFCIGLLVLRAVASSGGTSSDKLVFLPLAFVLVPIIDVTSVLVRRMARGASPMQGDRLHLYDEFYRRFGSVRMVVVLYYAATMVVSASALLIWTVG